MDKRWIFVIIVIAVIALISLFFAAIASLFIGGSGGGISFGSNVAVIKLHGTIMPDRQAGLFSLNVASSSDIVNFIEAADNDPKIKAILLEINSGGGAPVASEEIVKALKKSEKYKVAMIRELGASGAYWVASAADDIVASPMSITGSVGVLASYLEFSGFLKDYNITYQRLVGGKYKDIGSPFKKLAPIEEMMLQETIDELHDYFLNDVVENRGLTKEAIEEVGTGLFFTGLKAKKLGLVDVLGGKDEVIDLIENKIGEEARFVEYKKKAGFSDILSQMISGQSFWLGQGIGDALFKKSMVNEFVVR